ncbi:MAG: hypothetical protein WCG23_09490 [bacterium]
MKTNIFRELRLQIGELSRPTLKKVSKQVEGIPVVSRTAADCAESLGRAQVAVQRNTPIGLENLTEPISGSAKNYCYLVHAVSPYNLEPGSEFFKKPKVSCSVINDEHPETYGEFGFILGTIPQNIQNMLPEAGGTKVDALIKVLGGKVTSTIMHLSELLSKTQVGRYNEVVVTRNPYTKIKGVFCKVLPDGKSVSQEAYNKALSLSRKHNCLLVLIPERATPFKVSINEHFSDAQHYICIKDNGLTYYIELGNKINPDNPFRIASSNKIRAMEKDEFERILGLAEQNIPEAQKVKFRNEIANARDRFQQSQK